MRLIMFNKKILLSSALLMISPLASAEVIDFNNANTTLYGDATYGTANHNPGGVILTQNAYSKKGSVFTNQLYSSISEFNASFDIRIGPGGNGADGLTFAWVSTPGIGTGGGYLGYQGLGGYSIEFDTYNNGSSWDNNNDNHIAVNAGDVTNSLTQTNITDFNLNDDNWRTVDVSFTNGLVNVDISGQNYINYQIQNYSEFDGYFGFTAATGGESDWHKVRNFELSVPVSAVPEPSTYALMAGGLGLIGFMAARRRKQQA